MADTIGAMRERLILQQHTPPVLPVTRVTRGGAVATVTLPVPHPYLTTDYVLIAGALPIGYGGKVPVTVTGPLTFTYPVSTVLATPATGAITVVYVSDAQGGRAQGWRTLDSVAAEMVPLRTTERLQLEALQPGIYYQFVIRSRPDLDPSMRVLWTPAWPPGSPTQTVMLTGIRPQADSYDDTVAQRFLVLDGVESPAVAA